MNILEIYNGEGRTDAWWSIIKKHTAILSALLAFISCIIFFFVADIYGSGAIIGLFFYTFIVFLLLWPIFIGISMLAPQISFALFYLNGWIIIILTIPINIIVYLVVTIAFNKNLDHTEDFSVVFFGTVLMLLIVIVIKTIIILKRFRIMSPKNDKYHIPI